MIEFVFTFWKTYSAMDVCNKVKIHLLLDR